MKSIAELDHYEVLETHPKARPEEIDRAYRLAVETYSEDSLAGYSLLAEGETSALREKIELAYSVLRDPDSRFAYDATLSEERKGYEATLSHGAAPEALPVQAFEEHRDGDGEYDGARLRRTRLRLGLEIDQVAAVTKISPMNLQFIENEGFDKLPAPVYVRGFVVAFAQCLGLEGDRVAASYMKSFHESRANAPRSGFFERARAR